MDASFAIHPDLKSHTRDIMTMGQVAMQQVSRKQKLNTRISTEAGLVPVGDVSVHIFWEVIFIKYQGYKLYKNILYEDNKRAILMEVNGKKSAGNRTWALNIH